MHRYDPRQVRKPGAAGRTGYPLPTCLLLLGFLLACSAPRTHYDYHTGGDFSGEGYAWLGAGAGRSGLDEGVENYVEAALAARLEAAGLHPADGRPELLVTWHLGQNAPIDPEPLGYRYWPPQWARGGYPDGAEAYVFRRGALIVDLVDASSGQLLWRGSERGVFRGSIRRQREAIDSALVELLDRFPPPALRPRGLPSDPSSGQGAR